MLTVEQYFGKWLRHADATDQVRHNARLLVAQVNNLIVRAKADGIDFPVNKLTGSIVSGENLGGFRPQSCPVGAPNSAHKQGLAVDLYDPENAIDKWLNAQKRDFLAGFNLYFEHQDATPYWSHWSLRAPKSGRRFFQP